MQFTHYAYKLGDLWRIVWPIVLAALSGSIKFFSERLILARYSSEAFIAFTTTQACYWTLSTALAALISVTEILVGQYNGAHQYRKIGSLIWQMIIVALSMFVFMLPVIWIAPHLVVKTVRELGVPYLRTSLFFLPIELAGLKAIGAFFLGRGEIKPMAIVLGATNALNILLDVWFIHGGIGIPAMGIRGAAYATGLAQLIAFFVLLKLFLRRRYRERYGVGSFKFSPSLIKRWLALGLPNSFNAFINVVGWALACQIFALKIPKAELLAYGIAHSFYTFFGFCFEGIGKGSTITISNLFGGKKFEFIGKALLNSLKISGIFIGIALIPMIFFPLQFVSFFVEKEFMLNPAFLYEIRKLLFCSWLLFFVEMLLVIIQSFWLACGNSRFTMAVNVLSFWLIALLPTYVLVGIFKVNLLFFLMSMVADQSTRVLIFFISYYFIAKMIKEQPTHQH